MLFVDAVFHVFNGVFDVTNYFNMFSMMFAKTSLLFCWFRMVLCETSMLLFVSVLCYAKPRCYY